MAEPPSHAPDDAADFGKNLGVWLAEELVQVGLAAEVFFVALVKLNVCVHFVLPRCRAGWAASMGADYQAVILMSIPPRKLFWREDVDPRRTGG